MRRSHESTAVPADRTSSPRTVPAVAGKADHPVPSDRARELVRGGFDPHVHVAPDFAPRRITDLELAQRCLELGLAGFGLKSHYTATAERAAVVNAAVPGVRALGTITLNHAVGGLNATAVEVAARQGARIVWLPTVSARERVRRGRARGPGRQGAGVGALRARAARGGRASRSRCRCSTTTARRCRSCSRCWPWSRAHDLVLATGHLSRDEIFTVVDAAVAAGVETIVVTHPEFPSQRLSPDDQERARRARRADGARVHDALHRQVHVGRRSSPPPARSARAARSGAPTSGSVQPAGRGRAGPHGRPLPRGRLQRGGGPDHGRREHPAAGRCLSRRVQVIGAHSADFVWRAGGAVAKAVAARRRGRGDRAVLRRARRVGRAVEAGGPDDRERQADPPRRGRGRRGAPRRHVPLPGPRRLPAADRRRRAAARSPTRSASSRPTC